jgi:chromosome transmission fidelity protein 18
VNRQIIRSEERTTLTRLVSVMIALDLQFVLDRNEDGQPIYRLEPYVVTSRCGMSH